MPPAPLASAAACFTSLLPQGRSLSSPSPQWHAACLATGLSLGTPPTGGCFPALLASSVFSLVISGQLPCSALQKNKIKLRRLSSKHSHFAVNLRTYILGFVPGNVRPAARSEPLAAPCPPLPRLAFPPAPPAFYTSMYVL